MKRKTENLFVGGIFLLLGVACIALVTNGFKNNPYASSSVSERQNLIKLNLETEVKGQSLSDSETDYSKLLTFLNSNQKQTVFTDYVYTDDVANLSNVYKDNGGLRLGNKNDIGYFEVTTGISETAYKFNRVAITGYNYGTLNSTTDTWTCDVSGVSVNGLGAQMFTTNILDTSKQAPKETKKFELESLTNNLKVTGIDHRLTITQIELWVE